MLHTHASDTVLNAKCLMLQTHHRVLNASELNFRHTRECLMLQAQHRVHRHSECLMLQTHFRGVLNASDTPQSA